jgi:hypothetical protein
MKKITIALIILIISLFTASIAYSQDETDDALSNWAIQVNFGGDFTIYTGGNFDPENLQALESHLNGSITVFSLFENGGIGFEFGILPLYDICFHLVFFKSFPVNPYIAPTIVATAGVNYVDYSFLFNDSYPGFGGKFGGLVSFSPTKTFSLGVQLMFAFSYGRSFVDPGIIEHKFLIHIPLSVFVRFYI